MKVRNILIALLPLLVLLPVSCNFKNPHFPVLVGNYAYGRGDYQEATVQYLEALGKGEYKHWIEYDLANVYHSLGEFDAAFELWDDALNSDDINLLYAIQFNRGILFYEQGKYEDAFECFKTALTYDPMDRASKINLELTLLRLQGSRNGSQLRSQTSEAAESDLSADSIRMFEYIRRKEEQLWIQQNQPQQHPDVQDW